MPLTQFNINTEFDNFPYTKKKKKKGQKGEGKSHTFTGLKPMTPVQKKKTTSQPIMIYTIFLLKCQLSNSKFLVSCNKWFFLTGCHSCETPEWILYDM